MLNFFQVYTLLIQLRSFGSNVSLIEVFTWRIFNPIEPSMNVNVAVVFYNVQHKKMFSISWPYWPWRKTAVSQYHFLHHFREAEEPINKLLARSYNAHWICDGFLSLLVTHLFRFVTVNYKIYSQLRKRSSPQERVCFEYVWKSVSATG